MTVPTHTRRNQSMECFKLVAALLVILIHAPFPGKVGNLIAAAGDVAVPMFFVISGYFTFGADQQTLKRRLKHLLRLYLQGIVRCSCKREKNAEGVVVDTSCLTLDEARLEAIKAQGGRHSLAAINMVRYIRVNQSCSISKVLSSGFADDKDHYEIRAELQKETESGRMI